MKIEVESDGTVMLSDVFTGVGIKTDDGIYGIAQRDSGIEVMLDGRTVYPPLEEKECEGGCGGKAAGGYRYCPECQHGADMLNKNALRRAAKQVGFGK